MFSSAKFEVHIKIERVSRIPYSSGSVYVRWNAGETPRPETHGHTETQDIIRTEAIFDNYFTFTKKIGIKSSSRTLRRLMCKFEVIWEPIGGKGVSIGSLNLDLSQFASPVHHKSLHRPISFIDSENKPIRDQSISYLLAQSKTNTLLTLNCRADWVAGERHYEIPEFDAPAIRGYQHDRSDPSSIGAEKSAKFTRTIHKLKESATDTLLKTGPDCCQNEDWFDIDNLLNGGTERYIEPVEFQKFKRNNIRNPHLDFDGHKQGTPYTENEVRESFITWKVAE